MAIQDKFTIDAEVVKQLVSTFTVPSGLQPVVLHALEVGGVAALNDLNSPTGITSVDFGVVINPLIKLIFPSLVGFVNGLLTPVVPVPVVPTPAPTGVTVDVH